MVKLTSVFIALTVTLLESSCILSSAIASHGLKVHNLKTEKQLEKKMGKPIYVAHYTPPKIIKFTPELIRNYPNMYQDSVDEYKNFKAAKLCVYQHSGSFYSYEYGSSNMMVSAMSFGIAEPWLIGKALKEQYDGRNNLVYFSVWFNDSGVIVASDYYNLAK